MSISRTLIVRNVFFKSLRMLIETHNVIFLHLSNQYFQIVSHFQIVTARQRALS